MIKKLTSRKFVVAVIMVIILLIVSDNKVVADICATAMAIAYIFAEAIVDNARAIKRSMADEASVVKHLYPKEENNN